MSMVSNETGAATEGTGRAVEAPIDSTSCRSLRAVCTPFRYKVPASFTPNKLVEILVPFGKPGLHGSVL